MQFNGSRIRIVNYSKGYLADHWCAKGNIVYCLKGEFVSELDSGEKMTLSRGMSYVVLSDNVSLHRSFSEHGVKILADGDFLK